VKRLEKMRVGGSRTKMQLSIPMPMTPDGRYYRYSPNTDAHPRHFVMGDRIPNFDPDPVRRARIKYVPGTPGTVCPYSGVRADDAHFLHPDDRKAALKVVEHAAIQDMEDAFSDMIAGLAKGRKSLTYKHGQRKNRLHPRFGRRDLMRLLVCDCCGRDYGVFAIALFCPDCGAPNLALHFSREVELVDQQVELAEAAGQDRQELAYRLLGNAHEDVLTAFEATMKVAYVYLIHNRPSGSLPVKAVGNDFQNIERGRKRFEEFSFDPFAELDAAELSALSLNIQKRHLIGHSLGVVDEKFAEQAQEAKLGETVELVATDIRTFAAMCRGVVGRLDNLLADHQLLPATDKTDTVSVSVFTDVIGDLTPEGTAVGKWICRSSFTGLPELVSEQAFIDAFPSMTEAQLADAVVDLAEDGYVSLTHLMSARLPRVHIAEDLFLTFDPHCLGHDPVVDTLSLIPLVLSKQNVSLPELHAESGLDLRRFNPAVGLIIDVVGEGRISRSWLEGYSTPHFLLVDEDRVAIRRLERQLVG